MKKTILKLFVTAVSFSSFTANAQVYQNDYSCNYTDPADAMTNDAIYKDVANHFYYIAQRPLSSPTDQIMITRADQNFNVLGTFNYHSLTSSMYSTVT